IFGGAERLCVVPEFLRVAFDDLRIVFLLHDADSKGKTAKETAWAESRDYKRFRRETGSGTSPAKGGFKMTRSLLLLMLLFAGAAGAHTLTVEAVISPAWLEHAGGTREPLAPGAILNDG